LLQLVRSYEEKGTAGGSKRWEESKKRQQRALRTTHGSSQFECVRLHEWQRRKIEEGNRRGARGMQNPASKETIKGKSGDYCTWRFSNNTYGRLVLNGRTEEKRP